MERLTEELLKRLPRDLNTSRFWSIVAEAREAIGEPMSAEESMSVMANMSQLLGEYDERTNKRTG